MKRPNCEPSTSTVLVFRDLSILQQAIENILDSDEEELDFNQEYPESDLESVFDRSSDASENDSDKEDNVTKSRSRSPSNYDRETSAAMQSRSHNGGNKSRSNIIHMNKYR